MNKTVLILKHEFRQTIKRKGFVIMTLAFPLIGLLIIGIYQIVQGRDTPPALDEEVAIGYIDEVGGFNDYINQSGGITFVAYQTEEKAIGALLAEDISEYFIIPLDYVSDGVITRYTLEKEVEPPDEIRWAMKSFLLSNLLEGQTSLEITERVKAPLELYSIRLDETGGVATEQGGVGAFIIPFLFGFLLIIAIFSSSGYLLQGLGEEKENRIMEILLSSVSTRQLLTGKVLGLGAAGLVQMVVWLISAVFLVRLASRRLVRLRLEAAWHRCHRRHCQRKSANVNAYYYARLDTRLGEFPLHRVPRSYCQYNSYHNSHHCPNGGIHAAWHIWDSDLGAGSEHKSSVSSYHWSLGAGLQGIQNLPLDVR